MIRLYLEAVTAVCLTVDHIHELILRPAAHLIPLRPVVTSTCALLVHVDIFRVVDVLVRSALDAIDYARLGVHENRAGNVSRVIRLVEEDIFAVAAFSRKVLEVAILVNAVLLAESLPELRADWKVGVSVKRRARESSRGFHISHTTVSTLASLERDYLSRHGVRCFGDECRGGQPHLDDDRYGILAKHATRSRVCICIYNITRQEMNAYVSRLGVFRLARDVQPLLAIVWKSTVKWPPVLSPLSHRRDIAVRVRVGVVSAYSIPTFPTVCMPHLLWSVSCAFGTFDGL